MASFEEEYMKANFKGIVTTAIISALGFLVALQWNNAISETIKLIISNGQGLAYIYMTSILVTVIATLLVYTIVKVQSRSITKGFQKRLERRQIAGLGPRTKRKK